MHCTGAASRRWSAPGASSEGGCWVAGSRKQSAGRRGACQSLTWPQTAHLQGTGTGSPRLPGTGVLAAGCPHSAPCLHAAGVVPVVPAALHATHRRRAHCALPLMATPPWYSCTVCTAAPTISSTRVMGLVGSSSLMDLPGTVSSWRRASRGSVRPGSAVQRLAVSGSAGAEGGGRACGCTAQARPQRCAACWCATPPSARAAPSPASSGSARTHTCLIPAGCDQLCSRPGQRSPERCPKECQAHAGRGHPACPAAAGSLRPARLVVRHADGVRAVEALGVGQQLSHALPWLTDQQELVHVCPGHVRPISPQEEPCNRALSLAGGRPSGAAREAAVSQAPSATAR